MASRYRLSIERDVNRKPQSKPANLVNYEPSPEPENRSSPLKPEITENIEFLQARLRSKAQIEHHVRKKLSDAHENIEIWKQRYQRQAERANSYREEMSGLRKRHSEEVAELNRELRWNHKKIKALERVIDENHQTRSPRTSELAESNKRLDEANELLRQENMRLSEQIMTLTLAQDEHANRHEQLILELEKIRRSREDDIINIQNLENAVKALHDENVILKETPIPVVLPRSHPRQRELGQDLFHYQSLRPTRPCISILDQRAQEKRRYARLNSPEPGHNNQERWPYSSSSEDVSGVY